MKTEEEYYHLFLKVMNKIERSGKESAGLVDVLVVGYHDAVDIAEYLRLRKLMHIDVRSDDVLVKPTISGAEKYQNYILENKGNRM